MPDPSAAGAGRSEVVAGDFFSRLHGAASIRSREQRARAFADLAGDMDTAQVQDAIARLGTLRVADHDEVLAQLFGRWGEFDSEAAMAAAQALPNTSERHRSVSAVLGSWIDKDPRAAEQWVNALPAGLLKRAAWETLIEALAINDPPHALALLQKLPFTWSSGGQAVNSIFDAWVGSNPREAAAYASQLPLGELRTAALDRVGKQWARIDLRQALAWAEAIPNQKFEVQEFGSYGLEPINSVLRRWVETDSVAAVRWLEQLPEGDKRAALISSACTFLRSATATPQVAMQLAQLLPEGAKRDEALQEFAQQIASEEPAMALMWIRSESDPERRRIILSGILSEVSGDDLHKALEFTGSLGPTGREDLISIQSANGQRGWNLADPATLAAWAVRQPDNQPFLNSIAASWVTRDADRAANWLQTLPAPARDKALSGIIEEKLFRVPVNSTFDTVSHFQDAERWIALLAAGSTRQSAYERLAERWLSMDAESAGKWLNISPLAADVRERLLKAKPR
ncbi:MAG TPA: hypothetical protein VGO90_14765 [Chthoniobacteraceae bacterium]|nr:hypothetical protein [Chthoniobacteraceae bacterium]